MPSQNKYAPDDEKWGTEPGTYTIYRTGDPREGIGFFANTYAGAEAYTTSEKGLAGNGGELLTRPFVDTYEVTITKPFVSERLADAYEKLFGKKVRLEPTSGEMKKGLTSADLWAKADQKIAKELKKRGHDAWVMTKPAPPAKREMNIILLHFGINDRADVFNKAKIFTVFILDVLLDLIVTDWVEVLDTKIFKLLLDLLHTKAVCQGSVDLHRFKRSHTALVVGLDRKRTHIVQPIAKLDENNADILRHCEQHLAQIFDMLVLFILHLQRNDLSQSVYQNGDVLTKHFFNFLDI